MDRPNRPADITALSFFFLFGALLCVACAIEVLSPATALHPVLRMLPALIIMGTDAISWMVFVGLACIVAAYGLWRCSYWGFLLATVVMLLFLSVHFVRALFTNAWWELLVILPLGILLVFYLRLRAQLFVHRTAGP